MSIASMFASKRCVLTMDLRDEVTRYGIELTDRWDNVTRVDDITSDPEFLKEIVESLSSTDISALHLRDVIEDMIIERFT